MILYVLVFGSLVICTYLFVWVFVRLRMPPEGPNAKDYWWLIPFLIMAPTLLGASILCWHEVHSTGDAVLLPEFHQGAAGLSLLFYLPFFGVGFFFWIGAFIYVLFWWFGPRPRRDAGDEFEKRFGYLAGLNPWPRTESRKSAPPKER